MTNRFDVLTQQLFQKNIVDCSVEELQNLADENPYFAPAQYALLTKLKEQETDKYAAQFQKAILFYHDPLSFEEFTNQEKYVFDFEAIQEPEVILPLHEEKPERGENLGEVAQNEMEAVAELIEEDKNAFVQVFDENHTGVEETAPAIFEKELISEENNKETVAPEDIATQDPSPLAVNFPETTPPATGFVFEPYHTVDYFASQGIKLSQEEASKDKFGKQLKSFTEWLKTMKKLPVAEQVKPLDVRSEQNVENLAAHSVKSEDVYTETMAEVWLQQGNNEKAIEIYNKLSLLNPSKRAYFAAKIESLK